MSSPPRLIPLHDNIRLFALFLYNTCLGIFLTYGLFFARVSTEFGLRPSDASFIFGTFALLYAVSSLLMGLVMDVYGAGKTILMGGILMGLGLLASSVANSFVMLLVTYGLVAGMGTGSMWLPTSFVVFDTLGGSKAREAIGLVSAGTAFGTVAFSPLEAFLITSYGWRPAFLVVGLTALCLALFAYAASNGSATNNFRPLTAIAKFRTRRFNLLYAYYLMGNAFSRTLTMIFVVPLLEAKGLGLLAGSLALALIGVGSIVGRFATRVKNLGEEAIAAAGFVVQGVCIAGFIFAQDIASVAIISILFGVGYGAYVPQFALMIRKYYGTDNYGTIFGVLLTSFGIGAFAGPVFEGYQLSLSGTYDPGFYLASAISIIVGLLLLALRSGSKPPTVPTGPLTYPRRQDPVVARSTSLVPPTGSSGEGSRRGTSDTSRPGASSLRRI